MASVQFTEEQTIPTGWRLMIFGGVTLVSAFSFLMIYLTEWDTMPVSEKWSLLTLLIGPAATLIIFMLRLDVRLTSGVFEYRVRPFKNRYKTIPYSKITQMELSRPAGIKSLRGIGSHRNLYRTDLNFGGRYLLVIRMQNGRTISVSSNKPQELKSFLMNLPEGSPSVNIDF